MMLIRWRETLLAAAKQQRPTYQQGSRHRRSVSSKAFNRAQELPAIPGSPLSVVAVCYYCCQAIINFLIVTQLHFCNK
jgi:hypothetical protein